jgi:hypothetical protein
MARYFPDNGDTLRLRPFPPSRLFGPESPGGPPRARFGLRMRNSATKKMSRFGL